MLDRVTGMQVFVRVVSLGSFSAAARSLGLSQTMVTKHIAALEERLGVKLLHRTTRQLTLTEAGRKYLDTAERILADVEDSEAEVSADHVEVRGLLRVTMPGRLHSVHVMQLPTSKIRDGHIGKSGT